MGKAVKLLEKLRNAHNTFQWRDLVTLLAQMGYEKQEMAGSRVRFYSTSRDNMLLLHKPHPENEIKGGALKSAKRALKQEGIL